VVEGLEDECIGKEGDAGISPDMRQMSGGEGCICVCGRGNGRRSIGESKSCNDLCRRLQRGSQRF